MADLARDDYDDLAYRMSLPDADDATSDVVDAIRGVQWWLFWISVLLALLLWRVW